MTDTPPSNRAAVRRERTRNALITTAGDLLAGGETSATIQNITDQTDVAVGTFYNHFSSREDLYDAAVLAALLTIEKHTVAIQAQASGDPAEVVSIGIRCFGRMPEQFPRETRIVSEAAKFRPLGPAVSDRFRRDVDAAVAAGRFRCDDLEMTLLLVAGGMTRVITSRISDPSLDIARVDNATAIALRMLGMDAAEADEMAHRPLPA
jgi:AcrR family transcriptional regulator